MMRTHCKKCQKKLEIMFPATKYCNKCSLEVSNAKQEEQSIKKNLRKRKLKELKK